jgi:thaumarchaeosortase
MMPALPQSGVPIQSFVPFTSSIVAFVLQQTGHAVQMGVLNSGGVQMLVNNAYAFLIYWPCAGIHSLFIYTFVILLFLKNANMSLGAKAICLTVGAVGTFFVNVLRIVSIINITITSGDVAGQYFHNYYGELYFLGWIVFYLFALVLVQRVLMNRSLHTEIHAIES